MPSQFPMIPAYKPLPPPLSYYGFGQLGLGPDEAEPSSASGKITQKKPYQSGKKRNVLYKPENIYSLETNINKNYLKKNITLLDSTDV